MTPGTARNRLANEKSPYLLQHAGNPVDWFPFGPEAIERARAEDKPIFLSIGYSTCHWCHVMERESFENPAIAALMNELYVNVKVDREERPDLDQIYMQAVLSMQGMGGWPLSVWLTPDLQPFYGGTYFPPDARYGRPGFPDILRTLADVWQKRRSEVLENGRRMVEHLARSARPATPDDARLDAAVLAAERALLDEFDPRWGGFGPAPKFPRTSILELLARREARLPEPHRREAIARTLEMMWRGGIYDHVGGGFARYSTDDRWLVPHFEKMLYDNALILEAYVDGGLLTGRQDFVRVAEDIATFVAREMTHQDGGFYSAQDADSEGEEGKFYLFTLDELRTALGADADQAARVFGAGSLGNFEGSNVLHWPASPTETAAGLSLTSEALDAFVASVRARLYAYREQRPRPGLDDKVLASWNGLMIHALARLGAVTGHPRWTELARRAAEFIEARLVDPASGILRRRFRDGEARFDGSLDDYAFHAFGLLGLFEATGESRWIGRVLALLRQIDERFADGSGGYWFAASASDLVVRMRDSHDGALPSANSMVALLQARVGAILEDEAWREKGRATVRASAADVVRAPPGFPMMLSAWLELAEPARTLVVSGRGEDPAFQALLGKAHRAGFPGRAIIPLPAAERAPLAALGVPSASRPASGDFASALLCEDQSCRAFTE